jgi:hypothetical protein
VETRLRELDSQPSPPLNGSDPGWSRPSVVGRDVRGALTLADGRVVDGSSSRVKCVRVADTLDHVPLA